MRLGRINRTSAYLIVISSLCCLVLVFIPNVDVLPARRSFLDNSRKFNVGPDLGISRFERRRDEEAYKVATNDGKNGGVFFLKLKEGNVKIGDSLNVQQNGPRDFEQNDRLAKNFDSLKTSHKFLEVKEVESLNANDGFSINAEQRDFAELRLTESPSLETINKAIKEGSEEMQARNGQTPGTKLGLKTVNEKNEDSINLPETTTNEDMRSVKRTEETPSVNKDEGLTQEQGVTQGSSSIRAENRTFNSTSQRHLASPSLALAVTSTTTSDYE